MEEGPGGQEKSSAWLPAWEILRKVALIYHIPGAYKQNQKTMQIYPLNHFFLLTCKSKKLLKVTSVSQQLVKNIKDTNQD
jgi:hypothetical protein